MNWVPGNSGHDLIAYTTHNFPSCANATEGYINGSTAYASDVIAGSFALLFYLVLLALSIFGVWCKSCVKVFSSQATFLLFLIGTMMVCVNIFSNADNLEVKIYFRLAVGGLVGILFVVLGFLRFFSKAEESAANPPILARQQPSMGIVVGLITAPLILAEIFLLVAATVSKKEQAFQTETYQRLWNLVIADKATFLVQKVVQAAVYIWMRYTTISQGYKENAQFYLKTLAFYNFIEWVDSQVNEDSDVQLSQPDLVYNAWFDVFVVLYKALIIDYRLLCSLLFLEHSLEDEAEVDTTNSNELSTRGLTISEHKCQILGFILGLMSLSAPICCALYYIPKVDDMPAWVHAAFTIFVNLAIVGYGAFFLVKNDLESKKEKNLGSSGVKIMVCCLGAVGFTCWMVKAAIAGYWAATANQSYYVSVLARFGARCISTVFLMALFLKVNSRSLPQKNPDVKSSHVLVPAVMLAIFGAFSESLIDQYLGPLDRRLRCEIEELSLDILFEAGPPMYLGFLIHMFLHFFIIEVEILKSRVAGATRSSASTGPSYGAFDDSIIVTYV